MPFNQIILSGKNGWQNKLHLTASAQSAALDMNGPFFRWKKLTAFPHSCLGLRQLQVHLDRGNSSFLNCTCSSTCRCVWVSVLYTRTFIDIMDQNGQGKSTRFLFKMHHILAAAKKYWRSVSMCYRCRIDLFPHVVIRCLIFVLVDSPSDLLLL